MWKNVSLLQRSWVWSIPISMAIGLLFGYFFGAQPLKHFIIPVAFVMVYPIIVTLNVKNIFKGRDRHLQITTQLINFVLIPLVAYFVGKLLFSDGHQEYGLWAVGLFLIGVMPTTGTTLSWTGSAEGRKGAAIKMVVFGLVPGAPAAPVYTKVFMGATVEVYMLHMFRQIARFVFLTLFAGLATHPKLKSGQSNCKSFDKGDSVLRAIHMLGPCKRIDRLAAYNSADNPQRKRRLPCTHLSSINVNCRN